MSEPAETPPPIPIFRVLHRYYIYDVEHVTYLRREHNIPGVLSGTLPQSPQQNIFLGLPLQLLAEEARLLVECEAAYIVDDAESHRKGLRQLSVEERQKYVRGLEARQREFQREIALQDLAKKEQIIDKLPQGKQAQLRAAIEAEKQRLAQVTKPGPRDEAKETDDTSESPSPLSQSAPQTSDLGSSLSRDAELSLRVKNHTITPTLSSPPLVVPPPLAPKVELDLDVPRFSPFSVRRKDAPDQSSLPPVKSPSAYALFKYLHSKSYWLTSGLRFGAHYSVYPGDPLRFHAHFLARGCDWDEDIDLLSVVGGGRLGTGVKKGYLIGGPVAPKPRRRSSDRTSSLASTTDSTISENGNGKDQGDTIDVRCFCIEWAGM